MRFLKRLSFLAPLVGVLTVGFLSLPLSISAEPKDGGDNKDVLTHRRHNLDNLRRLAIAMWEHDEHHGHFPPAALVRRDGAPLLSWRVLLLPYLGEHQLFRQFRLDEPWDSPHNKPLLARMPKVFSPSPGNVLPTGTTRYQVFTGKGTLFEDNRGPMLQDMTDGTANTVVLVEAAEAVPWTKPADLAYDAGKPLPRLGGQPTDGFTFATADGSAHLARKDYDEQTLRKYILRADGTVVDQKKLIADQ